MRADLGIRGAGDGNRTRTISLGIRPIGASDRPDLGIRCTASDRHGLCDTGANGPPMARRSCLLTEPRQQFAVVVTARQGPGSILAIGLALRVTGAGGMGDGQLA